MFKIVLSLIIFMSSLFSGKFDEQIISFINKSTSDSVVVNDVNVLYEHELKDNWYGYVVSIDMVIGGENKIIKDTFFTNGVFVSQGLIELKSLVNLKAKMISYMHPRVNDLYYNEKHLISGEIKAKNKIVIFSDPLCSYCLQAVPEILQNFGDRSDVAIFYYSYPLEIHPAAMKLSAGMKLARANGTTDVIKKVYTHLQNDVLMNKKANDKNKVATVINSLLNVEIKDSDIQKMYKDVKLDQDMGQKVGVRSTPTIFVNNIFDSDRQLLKNLKMDK